MLYDNIICQKFIRKIFSGKYLEMFLTPLEGLTFKRDLLRTLKN